MEQELSASSQPTMLPCMSLPLVEILGEIWELPDSALRDRWSRCLREGVTGRRVDATTPYAWTSRATIASIEARSGQWLMFHAVGLSNDTGDVVALVGPSGTGKSTAARTICHTDFGYVTDETVAVRSDGSVVPFPKPISVIPEGGGAKIEKGPDELGLRLAPEELQLRGIGVLKRKTGVQEPSVEPLDLLDGIIALLPETSALPHLPDALARLATTIQRCGGVHKITYGEASQLPDPVRHIFAAAPQVSDFRHVPPAPVAPGPGIVRGEHHDALEMDDELLILQGSTCLRLQGIGSIVWRFVDRPRSFAEVLAAVLDIAGPHEQAEELVRDAVAELSGQGLLIDRDQPV